MADTTTPEWRDECIHIAASIKAMGYNVAHERVIVRRDPGQEKSDGGLYLPDQAQRKPIKGTILAIGNGVEVGPGTELGDVEVLDRCVHTKYNPILIELQGPNGENWELETMHAADIYVTWRDARLA